jgi:hypothetical protein
LITPINSDHPYQQLPGLNIVAKGLNSSSLLLFSCSDPFCLVNIKHCNGNRIIGRGAAYFSRTTTSLIPLIGLLIFVTSLSKFHHHPLLNPLT